MKRKLLALYNQHQQLVLYGLIGLTGATLDFLFYILFYEAVGIPPVIASFLSVSIGILNNFILNSRHNFKVNDKLLYRFVNFYSIGLVGAVASSILIFILFNGIGLNAPVAKLLTIAPVVLLQFYFNKKYSFRDLRDSELKNHPIIRLFTKHRLLLLINIVFIIMVMLFIANKAPGESGPDENTHFIYNVQYIVDHHSLPVSGRDDTAMLSACRDSGYATVRCTYSYQSYPGANYVLSAIGASIWHSITGGSYIMGARMVAVLEGLIFLNFMYLAVLRLSRSRIASAAITGAVALIPQVIYTCSYVNQDSHSLMISGLLGYALVRFLQQRDRNSTILFGVLLGGALPLAKFNFFVLGPIVAGVLVAAYILKRLTIRQIATAAIWGAIGFVVLASFWYVRNLVLYHDLLGQTFQLSQMDQYHERGTVRPIALITLVEITQLNFFGQTFNSFYVAFGSKAYGLAGFMYGNIGFGLVALVSAGLYIALRRVQGRRSRLIALGALLTPILAVCALLGMSVYNSIVYDFQPQGRYLFPALIVVALALAQLYRAHTWYKYIVMGFLLLTAYAFFGSIGTFIQYVLIP